MAGLQVAAAQAGMACVAATLITVLQVKAPTNQRLKILGYSISFDGVTPTATPVLVQVYRQTTAGTMSSLTPKLVDENAGETPQGTYQHTATVEPTKTDLLKTRRVHPQGGSFDVYFPAGQEIIVKGGNRVGLVITAAANVNCSACFDVEE